MSGRVFRGVLTVFLITAAFISSCIAQSRITNPITFHELNAMREGKLPNSPIRNFQPSIISPFERVVLPQLQKHLNKTLLNSHDAAASSSANFQLFYSAPYVSGSPATDTSQVFTSATADFDGKTGPDIATVQYDGTLNILFNNGHGKFASTYTNSSAAALNPGVVYIQQADLNNDGYPDIVAMDGTNSAFLVFLNKKDGTFSSATSTPVTPASGALFANGGGLALADVNGDGKTDVVTIANLQMGNYPNFTTVFSQQTFLGNGDGTFQTPKDTDSTLPGYFYVQYGQGIAITDLDADGNSDTLMEVARNDTSMATLLGASLGDGQGGFAAVHTTGGKVSTNESPQSALQIADLNHDGFDDALFISFDGTIYESLGNGDGTFQTPTAALSNVIGAYLLGLGDFDNDSNPDLIIYGFGQTAVFHGNGDGTFAPAALGQYVGSLGGDQQPSPADFNGDGKLDFAWVESVYNKVSLYINRGDGTFQGANVIVPDNTTRGYPNNTEWGYNVVSIAIGDFNADGRTDTLNYDFTNAASSGFADVDFGLSDGKGTFHFTQAIPGATVGSDKIVSAIPYTGDFNGDRRSDVIFSTDDGMSITLANADGTLGAAMPVTFPVAVGCTPANYADVGDMNGDGKLDIVAAYAQNPNCPGSQNTPSGIFVFLGDGAGHFTGSFTPLGYELYFIRLADFNNDGKLDVGVADLDGASGHYNFYVVPGNGDGTLNTATMTTPVSSEVVSGIVTGDFNADGKQDLTLLTAGQLDGNGNIIPNTSGALVLPGNGNFTFGKSSLLAAGIYPLTGAYGDFNRDGKPDLAIAQFASTQDPITNFGLIVLPGLGNGTFGSASNYLVPQFNGSGNSIVFAGDFNHDGAADIMVGGAGSSAVFVNRAH